MEKINYKNDDEKDQIISQKQNEGKFLITDGVTLEGNYLIFDDQPLFTPADFNLKVKGTINAIIDEGKFKIPKI